MGDHPAEDLYDPSSSAFQEQIWDVYRRLRDEFPVHHDEVRDHYVISRFEDVRQAAMDWASYSSVVPEASTYLPQMIYIDPPRHTQLRALVSRAFTPKRVASIEPLVRSTARDLLDGISGTECEAQHEYAAVLPSIVIAKMIGVPDEHVEAFRVWTESFLELEGLQENLANCYELLSQLFAERRRRPADDLMTALLAAEVDGARLTDEELLGFCFLLVLAGNDTTASLIGNGLVLLARDPEQRAKLVADPELWRGAVEEVNRIESPTQVLSRTSTRDVELHGVPIPAGSRVMLVWGAANHDEREYPDPERFDITRPITRHLAFGHGIHHCLGANLARLEARVAFEEWHARFPNYQLASEPRRVVSVWARAHASVPLHLY